MSSPHPLDYLTVGDLLEIGAGVVGEMLVRDRGLLASAAARPATTVFGSDAYPTLVEKAAALMHSLARNHALVDGNKRLAWAATRAFCLLNGADLRYTVDDAEQLVLAVAAGTRDMAGIAVWIEAHISDA